MDLGLEELTTFFDAHRHDEHLVVAVVIATGGSTYRKTGAMVLVAADGSHAGLISGGCLEGDLVQHAAAVFADGQVRRLSYDLNDDPELLMGLGLGCGGDIHLLLQRLDREQGFGVLPGAFAAHRRGLDCLLAVVTETGSTLPAGLLARHDADGAYAGPPELEDLLPSQASRAGQDHRWQQLSTRLGGVETTLGLLRLAAAPLVLVCGAGPDAAPLVAQVRALGWRCVVVDHRPAFARPERFATGAEVLCLKPGALAGTVALQQVEAAVVMTHHLGHDEAWLRALLARRPAYLGLLGPDRRRRQLAQVIGVDPALIHGPAGLDLGAELPAAIALSVMAEIHAVLNGRDAVSLSDRG